MKIYKRPEFYDIFGMLAFIYIVTISLFLLLDKEILFSLKVILLAIGIIGLIVDVTVVYNKFLK